MISHRNVLSILELVYFVPALILSLIITRRHGFSRQLGWIALVVLSLFRISGASTEIAATFKPSTGLITASFILQSFGLASLIFALQGLVMRLNSGMPEYTRIPPRLFKYFHLPMSAGIALASVGGAFLGDNTQGNNSEGHTLQRVGVLLFLAIYVGLLLVAVRIFTRRDQIASGDNVILMAVMASLPLLAIRLVFSILVVFDVGGNTFNYASQSDAAVIADALMCILEEFAIVAIYLAAGFAVPVIKGRDQSGFAESQKLGA